MVKQEGESGPDPESNGASTAVATRPAAVHEARSDRKRSTRNGAAKARSAKADGDEDQKQRRGDPGQWKERRREQAKWRRINIAIIVVILGGGAVAFGFVIHSDRMKPDEAAEQVTRDQGNAVIANAVESSNADARLQAVTTRLKALRQGSQYRSIAVKRQFGVDAETGLGQFEAYGIGIEPFVILGDPDRVKVTGLFSDYQLAKVGRSAVTVTHTALATGIQSESTEYRDVFEVVTPERIAALEQQEAQLKSGSRR